MSSSLNIIKIPRQTHLKGVGGESQFFFYTIARFSKTHSYLIFKDALQHIKYLTARGISNQNAKCQPIPPKYFLFRLQ